MARNGYSAAQIRAAEAPHLAAGEPLMQRAAAGLAAEVWKVLAARLGNKVLLLVGTGDNGGDALFAGADLAAKGVHVVIVASGDRMHEAGLEAATSAGARVSTREKLAGLATRADVIVDGLVGIGANADPALRGTAKEMVAAVLPVLAGEPAPSVVAVDIPSGINPDDGTVPDPTVLPANVTVTFGALKAGLLLEPAATLAGEVRLIDIGIGKDLKGVEPLVRVDP